MHSPSALRDLDLCPRKYAWDKIDKVPRTSNRFGLFGTKVHNHVEAYYTRGIMPPITEPEGNCAIVLLSHLPAPQPGIRIEHHHEDGRYHGYVDLTLGTTVYDHKTCGSFQFALSTETIVSDLQACLYAHFLLLETGSPTVTLHWNYVTRDRKPRVLPVVREVTRDDIAPTLNRARRLAFEADVILKAQTKALDLPPNPAACDLYGGCVHRERCTDISASSRMEQLMRTEPPGYDDARANAQLRANETGLDHGIAAAVTGWSVWTLPARGQRFDRDLNCEVVHSEKDSLPGHGPTKEGSMTTPADFMAAMAPPPPPPPAGNPWDGLPPSHISTDGKQWYNANAPGGPAWVDKVAAAPPPPPPAPPPAPPAINPPPPPVAPTAAAAPITIAHQGGVAGATAGSAILISDEQHRTTDPNELIARGHEMIAEGYRIIANKPKPGRPKGGAK